MGNCLGTFNHKKKDNTIHNINKVKINTKLHGEFEFFKIATCNVNIKNTLNLNNRISEIVAYFNSEHKNKNIDILCLQGVHDYYSATQFIKELQRATPDIKLYFAPTFDDIKNDNTDKLYMPQNLSLDFNINKIKNKIVKTRSCDECKVKCSMTKKQLFLTNSDNKNYQKSRNAIRRTKIQNIIISKHKIISRIYAELNKSQNMSNNNFRYNGHRIEKHKFFDHEQTKMNFFSRTKSMIGANISISKNIISIYNITLTKDIKSSNIINEDIREKELDYLFKSIDDNKKSLTNDIYNSYIKTNIHILTGEFNINEMHGTNINEEFKQMIDKYRCIDIYRYLKHDKGYTNASNERMNYIFYTLTDDIYDESSQYYKKLLKVTANGLLNFIFKIYKIYFFDICVQKDIENTLASANYPVECVFLLHIRDKKYEIEMEKTKHKKKKKHKKKMKHKHKKNKKDKK